MHKAAAMQLVTHGFVSQRPHMKNRGLPVETLSLVASAKCQRKKEKRKEVNLYSAFIVATTFQSAQAWIKQCYLQITPRLPFLRVRSPDVATTATAAADIQLPLTTHLSTPKG